jgi:hypothetical protein
MSYIILRGRWCNIIVLNVHAPCVDNGEDEKDSFYEERGRVFDQFPRYNSKILLGDFNANVDRRNMSPGVDLIPNTGKRGNIAFGDS